VIEIVPDDADDNETTEDIGEPELHFLHTPSAPRAESKKPPSISLHAFTGIQPREAPTMKIWVFLGGRRLTALLDSGSSKNFINTRVVQELGIPLDTSEALNVTVGNGDHVRSPGRLAEVRGKVGGDYFWFDSHALLMGSLDMVIGVSWMSQLGDIQWNFQEQTFMFRVADKRIQWCGIDRPSGHVLRSLETPPGTLLPELLQSFDSLFKEPHGMPPQRAIEHRIRLKLGTKAVAVRPYRYTHLQKDELERQCAELLQGIIRASSSAFSSPALLVKKPDGS
jgi:hypothetical protein